MRIFALLCLTALFGCGDDVPPDLHYADKAAVNWAKPLGEDNAQVSCTYFYDSAYCGVKIGDKVYSLICRSENNKCYLRP